LALSLALGHADGALAARSGVESVVVPRAPSSPTRLLVAPTHHQVEDTILIQAVDLGFFPDSLGIGGGFGGLFSILIFLAIANFLVQPSGASVR